MHKKNFILGLLEESLKKASEELSFIRKDGCPISISSSFCYQSVVNFYTSPKKECFDPAVLSEYLNSLAPENEKLFNREICRIERGIFYFGRLDFEDIIGQKKTLHKENVEIYDYSLLEGGNLFEEGPKANEYDSEEAYKRLVFLYIFPNESIREQVVSGQTPSSNWINIASLGLESKI